MINSIINLWYVWFTVGVICFVAGFKINAFMKQPKPTQISNIRNWLVLMCVKAEKQLGGGTGQLKLRLVYDWFINKFPEIANIVSFETFGKWVDDALIEAKHLMETNASINNYVGN